MARLVAAPISRASILGGKLLTSFLLGLISMFVLVVATSLLFGASWGNPLGVAVLVVAAILSAMGIMALIATLARNAERRPTGSRWSRSSSACSAGRSSRYRWPRACLSRLTSSLPSVVHAWPG